VGKERGIANKKFNLREREEDAVEASLNKIDQSRLNLSADT